MGEIAEARIERMMDGKSPCGPAGVKCPSAKADFLGRRKRIVQVAFAGNYEVVYDFFTDLLVQVGDPVVCDTARGYSIGVVAGFVGQSNKAVKWIVQRVDVEGHKARLERELHYDLAEMLE